MESRYETDFDAQLQVQLTDGLKIAYHEQRETDCRIWQFLAQSVIVSLLNRSSGFKLVEGDLLALGRLPGGLDRGIELVNTARGCVILSLVGEL